MFLFSNLSICSAPHREYVLSACAGSEIIGTNCVLRSKHTSLYQPKNVLQYTALWPWTLVKTCFLQWQLYWLIMLYLILKEIRIPTTSPCYLFWMTSHQHLYTPPLHIHLAASTPHVYPSTGISLSPWVSAAQQPEKVFCLFVFRKKKICLFFCLSVHHDRLQEMRWPK